MEQQEPGVTKLPPHIIEFTRKFLSGTLEDWEARVFSEWFDTNEENEQIFLDEADPIIRETNRANRKVLGSLIKKHH